MIINDLDGYYIVFDTKNWNTELDTLVNILFLLVAIVAPILGKIIVPFGAGLQRSFLDVSSDI